MYAQSLARPNQGLIIQILVGPRVCRWLLALKRQASEDLA